jgi:hypothetical protein
MMANIPAVGVANFSHSPQRAKSSPPTSRDCPISSSAKTAIGVSSIRNGIRRPNRERYRSLQEPMTGPNSVPKRQGNPPVSRPIVALLASRFLSESGSSLLMICLVTSRHISPHSIQNTSSNSSLGV